MRLIRIFWNVFGIFTVDLSYNKFQYVCSTLLLVSCVYNFIVATQFMCEIDKWCTIFPKALATMYDRVLAFTTLLSRITIFVQSKRNFVEYKATVTAVEDYSPTTPAQLKNYETFSFAVVFVCLLIIVPTNVIRLYYLFYDSAHHDGLLVLHYTMMYVQNLSMCCVETQFVCQCFVVYTKFRKINDDLKELGSGETAGRGDNYPVGMTAAVSETLRANSMDTTTAATWQERACEYDNGIYRPWFVRGRPFDNAVELLRIRHWLTRQAVETLNGLFGVHMGLSVFVLFVMALFDIYYEIFHDFKLFVYSWLLQYSLRILMIILAAHYTMKQVRR